MSYLTALLAFSAIMIVLATLATIVVEGLHKLFRQRAKDFEEMLTNLYDKSIKPRIKSGAITPSYSAEKFAQDIVKNPAFSGNDKGWFRKIPIFKTDFEELSTQQFVEQFAQTEVGKELKNKISAATEQSAMALIEEISADFERFGEAATSYFQRRAHVLSVMVAFLLALTINVDAIKLYSTLAKDTTLSEHVISELDVNELENVYKQQIENAADSEKKEAIEKAYDKIRGQIRADTSKLEGLGLPIGHGFYPYCDETTVNSLAEPKDVRCFGIAPVSLGDELKSRLENWPVIASVLTGIKAFSVRTLMVITSQQGIAWLFSASLAGGLIGLGAPFWFKTYRFLSNIIPGFKSGPTTQLRDETGKVRTKAIVPTEKGRSMSQVVPTGTATLKRDQLYQVFRYAIPEQMGKSDEKDNTGA